VTIDSRADNGYIWESAIKVSSHRPPAIGPLFLIPSHGLNPSREWLSPLQDLDALSDAGGAM
jgi:hypothetical protein